MPAPRRSEFADRFAGATVVVEDDGRYLCAEAARGMLVATGLFEHDRADRGSIRPSGAVQAKLEPLARAAREGRRPSAVLCGPGGAAYLVNAGVVALSEREVVALDIRPLAPPMWSNRDLADAFGLTEREADVTRCLLLGDPVPSIAARLRLKCATVRHYLKLIYSKTATASQAQLVAKLTGGLRHDGTEEAGVVRFPGHVS